MTVHLDPVSAVTQLVLAERQGRDRGWYDQMAECYAEDSVVAMSWFTGPGQEFVARSRHMSKSSDGWGGQSGHRLAPPIVHLGTGAHEDRAIAELALGIEFRIRARGVEADLTSYCRNQYRARRQEDGTWKLVRLTSIYERDVLLPALPGTTLPLAPEDFAPYRASYRCLSWYHDSIGLTVRDDLLGDDRPEPVAAQYRAERAWLHGDDER